MQWALVLVVLALLGVAAVSRRLSGTPVTPAIMFVGFGLLVGPKVLHGVDLPSAGATVEVLAAATLALVLFSDASRVDLRQLRRTVGVPLRLLGIGLLRMLQSVRTVSLTQRPLWPTSRALDGTGRRAGRSRRCRAGRRVPLRARRVAVRQSSLPSQW